MSNLSCILIFLLLINSCLSWIHNTSPIFGEAIEGGEKTYYPCVLYDTSSFNNHGHSALYKMWYGTGSAMTGLAISNDGKNWTNLGTVMSLGYHSFVLYSDTGFTSSDNTTFYRMWYWNTAYIYDIRAIYTCDSEDGVIWKHHQIVVGLFSLFDIRRI